MCPKVVFNQQITFILLLAIIVRSKGLPHYKNEGNRQ